MKAAKNLLGCYRTSEANDPKTYTAAIAAVLSMYPLDVVRRVVDPRFGLPSTVKWLPTIAELKGACDEAMAPARREAERDRIRKETLEAMLAAPLALPAPPAPAAPAAPQRAPGTDYASMAAKYGRPIGVFETPGDTWNRWAQPDYARRVAEDIAARKAKEAAA